MEVLEDTIVATATPPGRGGLGVVRLSGPDAQSIVAPILRLKHPLAHAHARFGRIIGEAGEVLDEAVITYFAAPNSYTAEDVVEISAHGAPVLLEYLLRAAIRGGARLAQPGEFTRRAFLSGRLDLTQAEAVNDLIAAQTLDQAKTAAAQLGGSISKAVAPIKQALLELLAQLEAGVDFAEDDLDLLPDAEIVTRISSVQQSLQALAATYSYGCILREGAKLAIVGRPNAGKSSLFNHLLKSERAIVTAQPGTTRDPISERFALGGIPIELIDTAGLREIALTPEHEAERQGIERSRRTMAEADLVLHVIDASTLERGMCPEDHSTLDGLRDRPHLIVLNKSDLATPTLDGYDAIRASALTGDGLDLLRQAILDALAARPTTDATIITNLRQSETVREAIASLVKALRAAKERLPHEFLLLDLHEALEALDRLTGATTPDDILQLIFSSFCIGK